MQILVRVGDARHDPGPVQLLWSDGSEAPPQILTPSLAAIAAPLGTVDVVLRIPVTEGVNVRVEPPVWEDRAADPRQPVALSSAARDTGVAAEESQ